MSKRLHEALQKLTGQSGDGGFTIEGDEWWLKPEWSQEHETREEWKSRTFAMRFRGGQLKISEGLKVPQTRIGEAETMLRQYKQFFPGLTVTNFFDQDAEATRIWRESELGECPPGFTKFQDSCIPKEEGNE
jgi:hypothetical protein